MSHMTNKCSGKLFNSKTFNPNQITPNMLINTKSSVSVYPNSDGEGRTDSPLTPLTPVSVLGKAKLLPRINS